MKRVQMQKLHILFAIAIIDLMMASVLFTDQQYFSSFAMLLLLVLGLVSAIGFSVPSFVKDRNGKTMKYLTVCVLLVSILIIGYEANFSLIPPGTLPHDAFVVAIASLGSLILVAGVYSAARFTKDMKAPARQAAIIIILLAASTAAYLSMFVSATAWNGSDEIAANYYAASLMLQGQNPYTHSLAPVLAQLHETPTVLLNGSYEVSYPYPPLSFIAFLFIPALGIQSFLSYIFVLMFMVAVSAYIVYSNSGSRVELLLPLGVWFFCTYIFVGVVSQYLAISLFLLLAYLNRRKPLLSGCLLGLASSTIQNAWFALPFFYLLSFMEGGKRPLFVQALASAGVFLAISAAFVVTAPSAYIGNVASILRSNSLVFIGTDIMQYAVAFYPLPSWYLVFESVLVMLACLAAFYVYRKSAHTLLAIAPAFVFFLAWRNFVFYSLPFIPILLVMYYDKKAGENKPDIISDRKPLLCLLAFVVIASVVAAVYAHGAYASEKRIQLNKVIPIIYLGRTQSGGYYPELSGIAANVTNNNLESENLSFFIVSRSPNDHEYVLSPTLRPIQGGATHQYNLSYYLPLVGNSTHIMVIVFSKDYIAQKTMKLNISVGGVT